MRRPEEILEIAEILDDAAERLVGVLESSGAGELHAPDVLRQLVRSELDLAVVDAVSLAFGSPPPVPPE